MPLLFFLAQLAFAAPEIDVARFVLHSTDSVVSAVAHDRAGNIFVAGSLRGGEFQSVLPLQADGGMFLIKLDPDGKVLWATPLGTERYQDAARALAVDPAGDVWIVGTVGSRRDDVTAITVAGSGVAVLATAHFGGSGSDHAIAAACTPEGDLWIGGFTIDAPDSWDGFVARFASNGTFVHSMRVGGSQQDDVRSLALGPDGWPIVLIATNSPDFPGVAQSKDFWRRQTCIVRLGVTGVENSWCMPGEAEGTHIATAGDSVWMTGYALGPGLPVTDDAAQRSPGGSAYWNSRGLTGPPVRVVYDFAASSEALYAATDSGIWKTTDDGETWQQLALREATRAVVVHPEHSTVVFALGESGALLFSSEDEGTTWRVIRESPDKTVMRTLAVDPRNPLRLLAGGNVIQESLDGGATWATYDTQIPPINAIAFGEGDVVHVATDALYIWKILAAGGLYRSIDGGRTFTASNVTSTVVHQIVRGPDGALYAAGRGGIFKLDGDRWDRLEGGGSFIGLAAAHDGELYALQENGALYRVTDVEISPIGARAPYQRGFAVAVSTTGTIHTGGVLPGDGFLLRLDDSKLAYLSYFGEELDEYIHALATNSAGDVFIGGAIPASGQGYFYDGFVAKFDSRGAPQWSTRLGGMFADSVAALSSDAQGRIVAVGETTSREVSFYNGELPGFANRSFLVRMQ